MNEIRTYFLAPLPRPFMLLAAATTALYVAAVLVLMPVFDTAGDAPGYLEAMRILNGLPAPDTFTPNRILTTFGAIGVIAALASFTGNYLASWFFVNTLYFFGLSFLSYALFRRITGSEAGSILGALFVVGNYDVLSFTLNYLMDGAGWFWFMASLLSTYLYIERDDRKYLWYAALAAGIGTLFKEYAFFGFAPLGLYLIYRHGRHPRDFLCALAPLVVSLLPMVLIHGAVYLSYGYSYLDWYGMNAEVFAWGDWAWNASRSYLVVFSFLILFLIPGALEFLRDVRERRDTKKALFVVSLIVPALAVLAWPIITERLAFLAVPLAALLAAYAVRRYEHQWAWFAFAWLLYVVLALKTDALLLNYLYAL